MSIIQFMHWRAFLDICHNLYDEGNQVLSLKNHGLSGVLSPLPMELRPTRGWGWGGVGIQKEIIRFILLDESKYGKFIIPGGWRRGWWWIID